MDKKNKLAVLVIYTPPRHFAPIRQADIFPMEAECRYFHKHYENQPGENPIIYRVLPLNNLPPVIRIPFTTDILNWQDINQSPSSINYFMLEFERKFINYDRTAAEYWLSDNRLVPGSNPVGPS